PICREEGGVMCPSWRATHEEEHSTRGRAHLLWEMTQNPDRGDAIIRDGWRSEEVKRSLDLCLACKGCKSDCPVSVDVATYKAEFLSHYYEGHRRPITAYAFGLIRWWAHVASLAPDAVNFVTQTPGLRDIAKLAAGMPLLREILRTLGPEIDAGIPVVGLEPSCVAVFRDELTSILPHDARAQKLARQTFTLGELLTRYAPDSRFPALDRRAIVHGHCHHKAVMKMDGETAVLDRMGLDVELLDSGCCGMAGSFGFEPA